MYIYIYIYIYIKLCLISVQLNSQVQTHFHYCIDNFEKIGFIMSNLIRNMYYRDVSLYKGPR